MMMTRVEIWGLEGGWKEIETVYEMFCKIIWGTKYRRKWSLTKRIHSFTAAYSPGWTFGLHFVVSLSHTYRHTVGLLWTSDQPVADADLRTAWPLG
jgi:hypothetical protein